MEMVFERGKMPCILVEEEGYEGVKRIAETVAEDICRVLGERPQISDEQSFRREGCRQVVLCATAGKSARLKELEEAGLFDPAELLKDDGLRPKWEVYRTKLIALEKKDCFPENSIFRQADQALLIAGSDKRGTIYGMFSLSEYFGVTSLCYWGDAQPVKKKSVTVKEDFETLSKEPSVKYRGFFINDEWPCFGNWVMRHFGGFNAKAYEKVFEFLLRMKGNYLWPAMWSASFPLDGPDGANEELADLYGVVMGYSHHEPCLRASEEWDKVRGEGTRYGNEWNFYTNEQGLINYWEDALKRSGRYDNIITIGMRGERDTSMLGPDATVSENVALLKRIITSQRELIKKHVKRDTEEIPMLLALYKEVEPYFYGDESTEGLKDWDGLDGVTCMLCEDNYGYVRTLPTEEIRDHKGGFGMYYHFDYHGGPISYEWVDSTPLSKTWEQMSMVYEYGVRDVWIVNVGDVKFHEVPLTYFMALAYDYDKWGYSNPESFREYTKQWAKRTFPTAKRGLHEKIEEVFTEYIRLNGLRRPEALNDKVYHPCHYLETERMLKAAERVEALSLEIYDGLDDGEREAYYSMIHFPAMASMNLLKMHLYAAKNHQYASQGRIIANDYGRLVKECIKKDREYATDWNSFLDGKWSGMEMAEHVGFTRWNDDDNRYPVIATVEPVTKPRMSVSRADDERIATKGFGAPMEILVPDFTDSGIESVKLEIANGGNVPFHFEIQGELPEWLSVSPKSGEVEKFQEVVLSCDRKRLPAQTEKIRLLVTDKDARVIVEVWGKDSAAKEEQLPEMTFLSQNGQIVIGAEHFCKKIDAANGRFETIRGYGKYGCGVKVFPSTVSYRSCLYDMKNDTCVTSLQKAGESQNCMIERGNVKERIPELTYRFYAEEKGDYQIEFHVAPSNPLKFHESVHLLAACGGQRKDVEILPADYRGGENSDPRWTKAALIQEHTACAEFPLEKGVQELHVGAVDAGVVLERIVIRKKGTPFREAYLGAEETAYILT